MHSAFPYSTCYISNGLPYIVICVYIVYAAGSYPFVAEAQAREVRNSMHNPDLDVASECDAPVEEDSQVEMPYASNGHT